MKFMSGFVRLSSKPPWAKLVHLPGDNIDGYWTELGKHPVFLRDRDDRVHLPRTLRGRSVSSLRHEDLDAVPSTDSGASHYKLWLEDFNKQRLIDKIWNGYSFTPFGLILIDRWRKFMAKNHLDDVGQLGIDPKFSINLEHFDRMMQTPYLDRVRRTGRALAKKYRMIITLLQAINKTKTAARLDRDFYYHYDKLRDLLDFDAAAYDPETPDEEDHEDAKVAESLDALQLMGMFVTEVQPMLDPQMGLFIKELDVFHQCLEAGDEEKARIMFKTMTGTLMKYVGTLGNHPVGQAAQAILTLPSYKTLAEKIFPAAGLTQ